MENAKADCREVLAKLYAYLDGETAGATCAQIEAHLQACEPCLRRAGFEREFKAIISNRCRETKAPAELLQKIRRAMDEL